MAKTVLSGELILLNAVNSAKHPSFWRTTSLKGSLSEINIYTPEETSKKRDAGKRVSELLKLTIPPD